jgi:hypothetical protein
MASQTLPISKTLPARVGFNPATEVRKNSARKEIEFFLELYLDSVINSRTTQNPQPPENMLILKLPDDQARFARDGRSWGYLVSPLTL